MAIELVTGHAGKPHVTSEQTANFNRGFFGTNDFFLATRGECKATVINQNTVQIATGDIYVSGRHFSIDTPERVSIANGVQNKKRLDVIGIRYKKSSTGVETVNLEVIAGVPGNAYNEPSLPPSNITPYTNDAFIPLHNVYVNGISGISTWGKMFTRQPLEKILIDKIYPVGSVYISFTDTDPSYLFGGRWERIQDKFLLSSAGYSGQTGGEKEHTLTNEEMPKHRHGVATHKYGGSYEMWVVPNPKEVSADFSPYLSDYEGGNKPHNNMPPYITCHMWRRLS